MGKLSRAACALEPSAPAPSGPDTLAALQALHLFATGDLPLFVADFVPNAVFSLDKASFATALFRSSRLSVGGPSGLLFEYLRDVFHPAARGGLHGLLFELAQHVAAGCVPPPMCGLLGSSRVHFPR